MNENMSPTLTAFIQLHEIFLTAQEAGFSRQDAIALCVGIATANGVTEGDEAHL